MSEHEAAQKPQTLRRLASAQPKQPMVKTVGLLSKPKKNFVTAACVVCRKQKAKCSGERPACRHCVRQQIQCHYTTNPGETESRAITRKYRDLSARTVALEEVLELLKNLPDQDAQAVLQRIRSGMDIGVILNHVKTGDLLLQLSVVPETRFRYEFPYRLKMPEDCLTNNTYLDSLIYEGASLYSAKGLEGQRSAHINTKDFTNLRFDQNQSLYLSPFHAAEVVDSRLSDVKPSLWTTVCDDDVLMRDLLGTFLRCEYTFTAAFQKDLFLEDMEKRQHDFCSSLLVNVLLGYSCVCDPRFSNRAEYWNPHTLLYRFIAEAKRLWELEATEPRVTTIQAGMLFNVFYNLCGLDEIGQAYRIHAIALAHQIRLFDKTLNGFNERICKGKAFAAWSLYNWETLVGFSFVSLPLLRKPPDWDLPDPLEDPLWYGEIWIKYPLCQSLSPSYFGQVLKARSEFRVIMNEFCQMAYTKGGEVTWKKADQLLSRLKYWYDSLAEPLIPKTIALPAHLQLHMYYHHLLLTLYEPLLDAKPDQEPFPHQIVTEAKKHIQTLVRLYYLRHGFEAMDLFIVIPLMLAGSDCLDSIDEQTPLPKLEVLRSTLMLVAKGLYDQRRNHYLAEALFRVIRGRMRPAEVSLLRDMVNVNEDESSEKRDMMQAVRSHWPVSVVKKKETLDSHILTNMVETYAHLNITETPIEVSGTSNDSR